MCGRYTLSTPADVLAELFELEVVPALRPRYNIAPTQNAPIVRSKGESRKLDLLRWGLIPHWAKEKSMGNRMINARSETVADKPSFRSSFKRQRCLVPADGFYEWKIDGSVKQPYHIRLKDGRPFAMAGLWSRWQDPEGEDILTYTILTTEPNPLLADIHNRMPVILPPDAYDIWLGESSREDLQALLQSYPAADMEAGPVSRLVNNPTHDDPRCIEWAEPVTG
jgi:putative SOS response-associated peptidase YedK